MLTILQSPSVIWRILTLSACIQVTLLLLHRHRLLQIKSIICCVILHLKLSESLILKAAVMFSSLLIRIHSSIISLRLIQEYPVHQLLRQRLQAILLQGYQLRFQWVCTWMKFRLPIPLHPLSLPSTML